MQAPKPRHLGSDYAAQFCDPSIVRAYAARSPYPRALFATLAALLPTGPRRVLELGSGSGDLTHGLAPLVDCIDAVEPSAPMLWTARKRDSVLSNIRWHQASAESFVPREVYSLVVAAESLHWMRWDDVLPMIARALHAQGVLAIVTGRSFVDLPWQGALGELIALHSTNRDYRPYDLVHELTARGLFQEIGRHTVTSRFSQSVDAYVDSFHSRNGFSRDRMSPSAALAFDLGVRALVLGHSPRGVVAGDVAATVVWGRPCPD